MKIIAYMRVSKKIGMTVENQRPIIEKWISEQKNVEDVKWCMDEESTRKTREGRNEAIIFLKEHGYDTLVCVRLDRWGRSTVEVISSTNELVDLGKRVVFINSNIDVSKENSNPMTRFMITILGAFAELERDLIRERTLEGLERAKSQGKKLGRQFGSKDRVKRRKVGYLLSWEKRKMNKGSINNNKINKGR